MINHLKQVKLRIKFLSNLKQKKRAKQFRTSETYWETRYAKGGNSGAGSYGRLALFKAEVLNGFVKSNAIGSVIEFGCGDGNQLSLSDYPRYIGLDVSRTIIQKCSSRFKDDQTKSFFVYDSKAFVDNAHVFTAELGLSLDVVYHLVEDEVFEDYMNHLLRSSSRFVIVYASNEDLPTDFHLRHRQFTKWIEAHAPAWKLIEKIPNRYPFDAGSPDETSFADFYVFEKRS